MAESTALHGSVAEPKLTEEEEEEEEAAVREKGYKGRRHLVSPRRV